MSDLTYPAIVLAFFILAIPASLWAARRMWTETREQTTREQRAARDLRAAVRVPVEPWWPDFDAHTADAMALVETPEQTATGGAS